MSEWRFMVALSERLGFDTLSGYANEDHILNRVFQDSGKTELDPAAMRRGVQAGPIRFGTLLENGFNTPSGKIEIYAQALAERGYGPLPEAEDGCRTSGRYPYRLVTGSRMDPFNHSQHRNIPELLSHCPYPEAEIPREIASRFDLSTGDSVKIDTETGTITMRARIVEGMNPETISIPHGWPGKSNANFVVGDQLRDEVSGTPAYKAIPCGVRAGKEE